VQLRPAQQEILNYRGGRMAISAVPGSGKTFTLSLLAAELIAGRLVDAAADQQVLVVTYLNSSVDTFRARIRQRLESRGLPLIGFDVRTLHSLSLEIVRLAGSGMTYDGAGPLVADEGQARGYLARAVANWIDAHPVDWSELAGSDSAQRVRWRDIIEKTGATFIRTAKNERLRPEAIAGRLDKALRATAEVAGRDGPGQETANATEYGLLWMLTGIYDQYQNILERQGVLDFDDIIWQAVQLLEQRPDLAASLRQRWPYVLEDEAQDSVPLQELLLGRLTGAEGNWVRAGDPNQAITSSFTAAHPRFFNHYLERPDVVVRPLPNSGRCAPRIYTAANTVIHWVSDRHPLPEVRAGTFRRQDILPTPPGDAQPNPPDHEAKITIKVYRHREDEELPRVAHQAAQYAQRHPHQTLAILAPTHGTGYALRARLDALNAPYDDLLRGGGRLRDIAAGLHALLSLLVEPADARRLASAYEALQHLGHPDAAAPDSQAGAHLPVILRSVTRPELLLFAADGEEPAASLPAGVVGEDEHRLLDEYLDFLRPMFTLRLLPVDDMLLALSDRLLGPAAAGGTEEGEADLAAGYQIAAAVRGWRDLHPEWRLPELAAQLEDVARGFRNVGVSAGADAGFTPEPGRVTLMTQHGAKGMEWDAVFLVGIDGFWIPNDLDAPFLGVYESLGGDPAAEVTAQLHRLLGDEGGRPADYTATQLAHLEVISERLRLLYVGITRARRFLHLSRSRQVRRNRNDERTEPATILGVLHRCVYELEAVDVSGTVP
jgi:DNA helicase-2/ATP-dependent DNA helicase PcrA